MTVWNVARVISSTGRRVDTDNHTSLGDEWSIEFISFESVQNTAQSSAVLNLFKILFGYHSLWASVFFIIRNPTCLFYSFIRLYDDLDDDRR